MCRLCYQCRLCSPATLPYCLLARSPPLYVELGIPMHFVCNLCSSLSWRVDNETTRAFTGGEGNGVTSLWHTVRLVLLSSSTSSPFIYFRTPPHVPSSSNSIFTLLPLCSPSYLKPWPVHRNFPPKFLYS